MKTQIVIVGLLLILLFVGLNECVQYKEINVFADEDEFDDDNEVFDENWHTEVVDDDGWVGIDPSIAVDANGNPHISYYDQGNRNLKYAYFDGNSWQKETVDSEGDIGEESGIAIDDQGNPHISYIDVTTRSLKYATKNAGSWNVEIVNQPPEGSQTMATSIALDANDYPCIAYNIQSNGDGSNGPSGVNYARWNGSTWLIETILTQGSDVQLVIDSKNTPHLSFKTEEEDTGPERICYATKTLGEWEVEIVDSETITGGDCDIAIDSRNHPHIAYNDYGNAAIKYAKWDGASWTIRTVAINVGKDEGLKIAVDTKDVPHVIYSDYSTERLMYSVWNETSWAKEIVDKLGNPDIAIDHKNRVHVAHTRTTDENSGDQTEIEILKYSIRESENKWWEIFWSRDKKIEGTKEDKIGLKSIYKAIRRLVKPTTFLKHETQ